MPPRYNRYLLKHGNPQKIDRNHDAPWNRLSKLETLTTEIDRNTTRISIPGADFSKDRKWKKTDNKVQVAEAMFA